MHHRHPAAVEHRSRSPPLLSIGMMSQMAEITVVHLASASLGREPLQRFLSSYRDYPSGVDHDLIIVFNGFSNAASAEGAGFLSLPEGIPHRPVFRSPLAIDLLAYLEVNQDLQSRFACFLNTNSVILSSGWLHMLNRRASEPGVGIVGATGSFETHRHGLPASGPALIRRARGRLALRARRDFPPFPNPHVRTNAFMVSPDLLRALEVPSLRTKAEAHRFESGCQGLTALIRGRGLEAEVVGRNGCAYPIESWPSSGTFRSGSQDNLLVSDNRTREWDAADPVRREALAAASWGQPTVAGRASRGS